MKRKRYLGIVLAIVVLFGGISVPETKVSAAGNWPSGPSKSKLACESAVVMELSTGTILYDLNMHEKHYPASITKILTAMLTAENCSMNEVVTFSESAVYGIESGSSTIYSAVGEKLTVEQCLYAIMLESANEVCLGVGEHIAGTSKNFVKMMNQRVKELGLTDTHFNNPNGLPDPKHYTSAHDMAVISRTAMQNDSFRKICNTRSYTCAKTNKHKMTRTWLNHHEMISGRHHPEYIYKYCTGGKTGFTQVAGNTLVTFAEKDGMELVCVVMKSTSPDSGRPNEYTDTTKLLNFGFEKYKKYVINEESSQMDELLFNNYGSYFDSENAPIHLSGEASVVLPKGVDLEEAKQEITYQDVKLQTGDNTIGQVTYRYKDRVVGSTDIIYTKTAGDNSGVASLDEASKKIVDSEINELEKTRKQDERNANLLKRIKAFFVMIFTNPIVLMILGVVVIGGLVYLLIHLVREHGLPRISFRGFRRRRVSGGYRSKRAKRNHRRRQKRESHRGLSFEKSGGRRRSRNRHYENRSAAPTKEKKSKGVRFHKKHKNTRESFGKNFFDF